MTLDLSPASLPRRGDVAALVEESLRLRKAPALALDRFTMNFVECGLGSCYIATDDDSPLRAKYTRCHIDIESLARMRDECIDFQTKYRHLYAHDGDYVGNNMLLQMHGNGLGGRESLAGKDFWHTRSGAGVGFWDGDWLHGDALTKVAMSYRTAPDLYVGDDGRVYYM